MIFWMFGDMLFLVGMPLLLVMMSLLYEERQVLGFVVGTVSVALYVCRVLKRSLGTILPIWYLLLTMVYVGARIIGVSAQPWGEVVAVALGGLCTAGVAIPD